MVQAWPEELSDELWGEMVSAQRLPKVPLDALISELLDLAVNEPDRGEDGVLPALVSCAIGGSVSVHANKHGLSPLPPDS